MQPGRRSTPSWHRIGRSWSAWYLPLAACSALCSSSGRRLPRTQLVGSLGCHRRCAEFLKRYLVSRVVARCGQRGPEWYHRHHVSAGDRPDESHNASPASLDALVLAEWLRHGRSDCGTLRTCHRTSCQASWRWHGDGQENGPSQERRDQR